MIYEKKHEPLLPRNKFFKRLARNFFVAIMIIIVSLFIGIVGYHSLNGLSWIDSLLNASMILAGMGPVDKMNGDAAKIFSSLYAIFSGVVFITTVAVILAPVVHRFLHKFHLKDEN